MKKKSLFLTVAVIMVTMSIMSCAWEDEMSPTELRKIFYQTHSDNSDSVAVECGNDSTYLSQIPNNRRGAGATTDSIHGIITVEGKVIVDGGSGVDLSDTNVTVEKIIVRLWTDGQAEPVILYPEANTEVAEPSEVYAWETMPQGLKYTRKKLCEQPVAFTYKDYFNAEVSVFYMLRVRDTKLAVECTADRYWNTVSFGSTSYREEYISVLVPLELHTISFNAAVDAYSSANGNE